MKGYISKFDRAKSTVDSQFSFADEAGKKRVLRQFLAKLIIGGETVTLGSKEGKFYIENRELHQGINHRSETQRPWRK